MVNEWTRDDLPAVMDLVKASVDAVVAHLNEHHPKPCANRVLAAGQSPAWVFRALEDDHQQALAKVERERDAAVARAEKAERERDTAREVRNEACGLARSLNVEAHQATKRAESAERERDAAEYAEAEMERERDGWRASADKWHGEWQKIAPARTVTREDVDEAVKGTLDGSNITLPDNLFDAQIDAVCRLLGVEAETADPTAALRAVLDVCEGLEEAHRANPTQMYEYGMEEAAHQVRNAIAAALGEGQ